jgi:hypothetical protein
MNVSLCDISTRIYFRSHDGSHAGHKLDVETHDSIRENDHFYHIYCIFWSEAKRAATTCYTAVSNSRINRYIVVHYRPSSAFDLLILPEKRSLIRPWGEMGHGAHMGDEPCTCMHRWYRGTLAQAPLKFIMMSHSFGMRLWRFLPRFLPSSESLAHELPSDGPQSETQHKARFKLLLKTNDGILISKRV